MIVSALLAPLLLASCGGGSSDGGAGSAPATITSISPLGIVQSTPRSLAIVGTNFTGTMTLSYTSSIGTVSIVPSSITPTLIIINSFSIATAPPEQYVTITISSGSTVVATTTLGVARLSKTLSTDIQPIFDAKCAGCHTGGAAQNYLNLTTSTLAASNLIETPAVGPGCSGRMRVKAGDPRSTSSVLIDKISNNVPCTGSRMTGSPTQLTQQDIADIIDWVAGGAP